MNGCRMNGWMDGWRVTTDLKKYVENGWSYRENEGGSKKRMKKSEQLERKTWPHKIDEILKKKEFKKGRSVWNKNIL